MANDKYASKKYSLVKHSPVGNFKYSNRNRVFKLKKKSPYMSSIKQVTKMLRALENQNIEDHARNRVSKKKYVTVMGLQIVIPKLLQLGCHFMSLNYTVEMITTTVVVLDEMVRNREAEETGKEEDGEIGTEKTGKEKDSENESDEELAEVLKKRLVSGLNLKIYAK